MFNLNFFQLDSTSFCLWGSAKTLDMIAFRYITTIYSLLLIALIIVAAHYCSVRHFDGVLSKIRSHRLTARHTIIHGITGFLVLSYSEFTSTSVNLLFSVSLYSKGHHVEHTAVYYNGELTYMGRKHLVYATPAILVLSTLGLIPPLLLMAYPLCYKIFAMLKLSESTFSHFLCTCIPLEKMKPLFDSFQSSFKDEYRFFSGLYFIFRLSTLVIQTIIPASGNSTYFYAAISIQSASIFAIHAICQPNKNKWHNILEGIFLFDITVIAMTFSTVDIHAYDRNVGIATIQLTLLYFPFLIMACYTGRAVWKKSKGFKCFKQRNSEYHEVNDSTIFKEAETRSKELVIR